MTHTNLQEFINECTCGNIPIARKALQLVLNQEEGFKQVKLLKQEKEELLMVNVSLAERIRFLNQILN